MPSSKRTAREKNSRRIRFRPKEGWSRVRFTGDAKKRSAVCHHFQVDAESGSTIYRVLLSGLVSWRACTADGNFEQMRVQVYEVTYKQEKDDPDGVTVDFDGLVVDAKADPEAGVATTVITKQNVGVAETVDVGIGYEQENAPGVITFRTVPISTPIHFRGKTARKPICTIKAGCATRRSRCQPPQSIICMRISYRP